jgi:putative membrane protein
MWMFYSGFLPMYDTFHGMWGMHFAWWIFWIVVVILGVWFVTRARMPGPTSPPESAESPLDILRRRYANGEISTDEYEERKSRLENMD